MKTHSWFISISIWILRMGQTVSTSLNSLNTLYYPSSSKWMNSLSILFSVNALATQIFTILSNRSIRPFHSTKGKVWRSSCHLRLNFQIFLLYSLIYSFWREIPHQTLMIHACMCSRNLLHIIKVSKICHDLSNYSINYEKMMYFSPMMKSSTYSPIFRINAPQMVSSPAFQAQATEKVTSQVSINLKSFFTLKHYFPYCLL